MSAALVRSWTAQHTTSGTSFPITVPANLLVGETLLIALTRANSGTISSITNLGTNSFSDASSAIRSGTAQINCIVIPITQQINSGTVLTLNFGTTTARKVAVAHVWSGIDAAWDADSGALGTSGPNGSASPLSASTTGSSGANVLTIGSFYISNTATDFASTGGSTAIDTLITSAGSTDRGVAAQYRVDAGAGGVKNSSATGTGAWAGVTVTFPILADPSPSGAFFAYM